MPVAGVTDGAFITEAWGDTVADAVTELERIGWKASATGTAHTGIGTTITTVNNTSATFTAVAGRRYRISVFAQLRQRTAAALPSIVIARGTTALTPDLGTTTAIDAYIALSAVIDDVPGAGSVTYCIRAKTSGSTVDVSAGAYVLVEDIGV